jgi:spore coat polysaccharide biosynthesis predicted glycosyltransferase SpsG
MPSILIYTEGGTFGLGHVVRCLHLASALKARGIKVKFASPRNEQIGCERIIKSGYSLYDYLAFADAIVIDVEQYPGIEFMREIRQIYRRVILIGGVSYPPADELAPYVDLTIYQGELFDYPTTDTAFNGPKYLIIDPALADCNPDYNGHILISMGGRDPMGFTGKALNAIYGMGIKIVIVTGPAYTGLVEASKNIDHVVSPPSLVPYVNGAALALVTTGMTAYECLAAGVPCVLANISSDHERTAQELGARGVAFNQRMMEDSTAIRMAVDFALLSGIDYWQQMSDKARALVDGRGTARVAEVICCIMAES